LLSYARGVALPQEFAPFLPEGAGTFYEPLKVKEVSIGAGCYVLCLNDEDAAKDGAVGAAVSASTFESISTPHRQGLDLVLAWPLSESQPSPNEEPMA